MSDDKRSSRIAGREILVRLNLTARSAGTVWVTERVLSGAGVLLNEDLLMQKKSDSKWVKFN